MCIMLIMLRKPLNPTHAQALLTLRTGKEPAELLRELYVEQGLSQVAIAERLGFSRNTIAMWLREFGLERETTA